MSEAQKRLPVIELFGPTVQGEGFMIGQMTHFVRFGGCGYRCSWCDSMHAVEPELVKQNATRMTSEEIGTELMRLGEPEHTADWVTLSGGDPVMHDLLMLSRHLRLDLRYKIAVETQGQLWKDWLIHCEHVTVSPKPPSSDMHSKTDFNVLNQYVKTLANINKSANRMSFKIPVFTEEDVRWALRIHRAWPNVPFYLSVGTMPYDTARDILINYNQVIEWAKTQPHTGDIRILPQMHVLLWGHKLGV